MKNRNDNNYVYTSYPSINTDCPDVDIINRNKTFYMVSTTMNMCPGVPIMKSTDLVHWQIVNYVYDTFVNDDLANLNNGRHMYAHGSWAASLVYDETTNLYYVAFNSNDHGFFIYTTDDIEHGHWNKHQLNGSFHDPALFFENEKMYVISCSQGRCTLQQLSLSSDRINKVGNSQTLFTTNNWGLWEGAHISKVNDKYYIFVIASLKDRWMRTQLCYRCDNLVPGYWEEKIIFQNGLGNNEAGLAQGGIVKSSNGTWYGFAFQDDGALGRVPSIVAVDWQDGWPIFGTYDSNSVFHANTKANGMQLKEKDSGIPNYIVDSDEFDNSNLALVWQWNHNPQVNYWSLTKRPGCMRLTTDKTVNNLWYAHNCLTQRTIGPKCTSEVKLYTDNMKPGDYAGISAVSQDYGAIGIMCNEQCERYVFQGNGEFLKDFDNKVISDTKIPNGAPIYLKIDYNFEGCQPIAIFRYSFDGNSWQSLGNPRILNFSTSTTFMGTRTWLFNYATRQTLGFVDFDYYKIY